MGWISEHWIAAALFLCYSAVLIGHAGKGYEYGLPWMIMAALLVAFAYLSWTLVAPRLRLFAEQWNAVTVPDLLAIRFANFGGARCRRIADRVCKPSLSDRDLQRCGSSVSGFPRRTL